MKRFRRVVKKNSCKLVATIPQLVYLCLTKLHISMEKEVKNYGQRVSVRILPKKMEEILSNIRKTVGDEGKLNISVFIRDAIDEKLKRKR